MHRGSTAQAGDSLIRAREVAQKARDLLRQDIDPWWPVSSSVRPNAWPRKMANHIPASLWNSPVADITAPQSLAALEQVKPHERARNLKGGTMPETLRRIRQRLESVLEDAQFHERCTGNPAAAVRRKLREQLPSRARGPLKALHCRKAPALMARLR